MSIFRSILRLVKHSAVYGVGHILTRAIIFLLMPLHTNIFPKADMGVAGLVFTYLGIFTIVYAYGLDTAFFRFYIMGDTDKQKNQVFTTAFLTMIATSILFSALIIFNAEWIAGHIFSGDVQELTIDLVMMVRVVAGILLFDAVSFMPFLILRAEERSTSFILFKFLNVSINLGFNFIFIVSMDMGVESIFYANLIASAVTFFALLPTGLRRLTRNFSRSMLKELFAFGIPYLPSTMCVALMDTVDRILLERLADVEAVGVFSQGHKLGMFMALFVTAFRFAWHPFFLSTLKQENAEQIFKKVFTYVITACTLVFLFFSAFIEEIVHLRIGEFTILGKEFWSATQVVPLIFLAYIFYAAYLNFLIGIYVHKKTKYLPWITFAGMSANVITNITLIPVLGMLGAAWARLAAYMVMSFTLYRVTRTLYPVHYEWSRIIKLAAVMSVFFVLIRWQTVYANTLLKAGLFLLYPAALYISGFFQRDELELIKGVLQRKSRGGS